MSSRLNRAIFNSLPDRKSLFRKALSLLIILSLLSAAAWVIASFTHAGEAPVVKLAAEERIRPDRTLEKLTPLINGMNPGVVPGSFSQPRKKKHRDLRQATENEPKLLVRRSGREDGFNIEFPPIESSSASGIFIGMGEDIIAMVEKRLNVTFFKSPSDAWKKHLSVLESRARAITPTIASTPERQRYALFTTPYTVKPGMIIAFAILMVVGLTVISLFLRHRLNEKIANLKAAQQELLDQSELLRLATEATPAGIWDFYPAKKIGYLHEQWYIMFGYNPVYKEITMDEWNEFIHPEDLPYSENIFMEYIYSGGRSQFETRFRVRKADHTWCWVLSRGRAIAWDKNGYPTRVIGLHLNIQNIKEAQDEIAQSEAKFRAIFENAPYPIVITSLEDGRYLEANKSFLDSRGISREELLGLRAEDFAFIREEETADVIDSLMKNGSVKNRETTVVRKDGTSGHITYSSVLLEIQGQKQVLSMTVDVTERRRAEEALKESEARFRSLFMNAPIPLIYITLEGEVIAANDRLAKVLGYTLEEIPDQDHWWKAIYPDPEYRSRVKSTWEKAVSRATEHNSSIEAGEYRMTCKDGTVLTMIIGGNVIGDTILVSFFDITELRVKESALKQSMELLRATFNATTDGILVIDNNLKVTQANQQFYKMWHIPPDLQKSEDETALREFVLDQLEDPSGFQSKAETLYHSRIQDMYELAFKDGRFFECYSAPMVMEGKEIGRVWDFRDISERKAMEEALKESEARFRTLFKMAPLPLAHISRDGRILEVNDLLTQIMGYTTDDVPTLEHAWELALPDPDFRNKVTSQWLTDLEHAIADNSDMESFECPVLCTDGTSRAMVIGTKLIGDSIIVSFFDVTGRKKAEEAIDFERRQLLSIFNSLNELTYVADPFTYEILFANQRLQNLIGKDPTGRACYKELQGFDRPCDFCTNSIILNNGGMPYKWEYHNPAMNIDVEIVDQIIRWPDGREVRLEFAKDITEQKQAEEAQEKLQDQLLQSQKLEAVGNLAGGVAHDFNNMLGAIIGYTELTMGGMDPADPFRKNLDKILDAAQRSVNLTRQLLAFARKQTIEPVVFDLNESVESMLKMIRRLIGENIELAWLPGQGPCTVRMDPSQLDQILVNLCVNAKDAIVDVGRVSIETEPVSLDEAYCKSRAEFVPGEYVLLAVSDDGSGIDKETMDHIFEPFFTTKGMGKGTGLGLATVYGIVKQNQGFINVYSEPGKGTTFRIYIPLHGAEEVREKPQRTEDIPRSRGETILIVEDDQTLLEMSTKMLQQLGYSVLSAGTPNDAIRKAEEVSPQIHLCITDVIMPEMNGRDLAERLKSIRPEMKHLFMSGYTADVIAHQGVLDEGVNFIQKPFSLKDLAIKIRDVLG